MFQKRITPFACIITGLICCTVTFVAVASAFSVSYIHKYNELRAQTQAYSEYTDLINSVGEDEEYHAKLSKMIDLIESSYVYEYDGQQLWDDIYRAVAVSIGDKYSKYLTAEEYNALLDGNDGNFVGIGVHASYDVDTNGIYIFGVMPSSPAEKGGLLKGDVIVAVEGNEATEDNYYDVLDLVRGEAGTEVTVTVLRGGERFDVTLVRASVSSENVIYEKLDNKVAYIKILSFSDETVSEQFSEKIELAKNDGCENFIFDVRKNTGGYLNEICDVLDLLLPEGVIINIVDKNGNTTTRNSNADHVEIEKMAVLCDEGTASAAELFTAALRDYELAAIVGETTFGKGSMQTTYTLDDGSSFKFSMALYNPPSNVSYDGVGITPDHVVPLSEEWEERFFKMPLSEDVQFQKALELVTSTN